MIVSEATPEDYDALAALWTKTGLTRPWNDPLQDINRAIACPTSTIFTAKKSGQLVGSVMCGYDGHRGWLYYLAVHPAHQKRGTGKALVNAAEQWLLKHHQCPKVHLMIRTDNMEAQSFYRNLDYERGEVVTMQKWLVKQDK